jgi:GTP-binding protein LepA
MFFYIVTGLKSVRDAQIWDTIIKTSEKIKLDNEQDRNKLVSYAIPGFKKMQPFVYAGVYPMQTDEYEKLKSSLEKLSINDSALTYEMESSPAFGFGYRCWFLGMLHMDIVKERLAREFDMETIFTTPNVVYIVKMKYLNYEKIKSGDNIMEFKKTWMWQEVVKFVHNIKSEKEIQERFEIINSKIVDKKQEYEDIDLTPYLIVRSWALMPDHGLIENIYEPFVNLEIVWPADYSWSIMELAQDYRGRMINMEYIDDNRVLWKYYIPLAEIIVDFHDNLKSITKGYASMNYEPVKYEKEDLVRLDIFINKEIVSAFSIVVHRDKAYYRWRDVVKKLKELIPKHLFPIPIQAVIGNKAIARETIPALRKDVLAKCYGWDVSRKRKLLEKQKEWKKKLKAIWKVNVPNDIFIKMLNRN